MKARTVVLALAGLLGLACVGAGIGGVLAGGGDEPQPKVSASSPAAARRSAQQVVTVIAAKWPLPNPRDTSSGCKAKPGAAGKGCESRVTTDAVTVAEFADEQTAARWAKELGKVSDARQAGRFVLSWVGDQDVTSKEARADMVRIASAL